MAGVEAVGHAGVSWGWGGGIITYSQESARGNSRPRETSFLSVSMYNT